MKKEDRQWTILEKAKTILMDWSKENDAHVFSVHFVPMLNFAVEVYVFYETDYDKAQNESDKVSEIIKQKFLKELITLRYMELFDDNITFIFDFHENVINNYQGSYFLRLR